MTPRYSRRVAISCSVIFAGDGGVGEGRILNLSLPGCLLESTPILQCGHYVQLRIFLPDLQAPLHVPLAAVRWVDGFRVGIEFIRTSWEDQTRLERFFHAKALLPATEVCSMKGLAVIKRNER